jgi:hypothetical protein
MAEQDMRFFPKMMATLALTAGAFTLGGCVYDDYGYGGLNVGYGVAGGYDDGYYGYPGGAYGYGYGYGAPGFGSGWYDNYYYPGSGYYVFDRAGRRARWNSVQRRYWMQRRADRGDYRGPGYRGDRRFDPRRGRPGIVTRDPGAIRDPGRPDRPIVRPDGGGRPQWRERPQYRNDTPRPPRFEGGRGGGGGRRGGLLDRVERRVERQQ